MSRPSGHDQRLERDLEALARLRPGGSESEPPASVDAAILASARQSVRAHRPARRWWVPASVAATALLAVSLVLQVQREGTPPAPPPAAENTASGADAAMTAPAPEVAAAPVPEGPASVADFSAELPRATAPTADAAPAAALQEAAPPAVRAASPQAETLKSRTADVPARAAPHAAPPAADAAASREEALAGQASGVSNTIAPEPLPSPEQWLARIEALESAGRHEEAEAERQRLEQAYPGWLAAHGAGTK